MDREVSSEGVRRQCTPSLPNVAPCLPPPCPTAALPDLVGAMGSGKATVLLLPVTVLTEWLPMDGELCTPSAV